MKKIYYIIPVIITLIALTQLDLTEKPSKTTDTLKTHHHNTNPIQTKAVKATEPAPAQVYQQPNCLSSCQQFFDILQQGDELTDKQKHDIIDHAPWFAAQLNQEPHLATSLIHQLFDDETPQNQNRLAAIEMIIAELNNQQKIHIAQVLTDTGSSANIQTALELLSDKIINTPAGFKVFQQALDTTTDQRVLNKALNLIPRITKPTQQLALIDNLTKVMNYSEKTHTYGVALMAKVAITTDPSQLYIDILNAIEHIDTDVKQYGLKAIESLLKQETQKQSFQWASNMSLELALELIVKDTNLPTHIRHKARDLMYEYFN